MARITQRQIEAFRHVYLNRSFSVAAQEMHVTQPAVSRLIRDLEAEVEFSLFRRQGAQIFPTPEARTFFEEVRRCFIGISEIQSAAREIGRDRKARVSMAVTHAASIGIMPEIAKRFHRRWPSIRFDLHVDLSPTIIERVALEKHDLGLALGPIANPGLEAIALPRMNVRCVIPQSHRLASKAIVSRADLEGEPLVLYSGSARYVTEIRRQILAGGGDINIVASSPYASTLCAMVGAGLGITIVDPLTAQFFGGAGLVAKATELDVPYDVYLIRPSAHTTSKPLDFLESAIDQSFRELAARTA